MLAESCKLAISVFVPGKCIPQPRPRVTMIGGHARGYEAKRNHPIFAWKKAIHLAVQGDMIKKLGNQPITDPVKVGLRFWFKRPKNMIWKRRAMVITPHAKRPDIDNLAKAALDAMDVLWHDDSQVYCVVADKFYVGASEEPGLEIHVMRKEQTQ